MNATTIARRLASAALASCLALASPLCAAPIPEAPTPGEKGPIPSAPSMPPPKPEAPKPEATKPDPANSPSDSTAAIPTSVPSTVPVPAAPTTFAPVPVPSPPADIAVQGTDYSTFHPAELLRKDAAGLLQKRECIASRLFVLSSAWVPVVDPRVIYVNDDRSKIISRTAFEALPGDEQKTFEPFPIEPEFYYNTRFGSPLAYARPLDLWCNALLNDSPKDPKTGLPTVEVVTLFNRKRIFDFGCGGVVHLQLLASNGADCVGVDVDPVLGALFSEPGDTGSFAPVPVPTANIGRDGSLNLVIGSWPGDEKIRTIVGTGFDLIISKNTLKNGYINPERDVDPRLLVKLGVTNEVFVQSVAASLNPGGYFLIYNLSPKQNPDDKPYIPWADGRSPFSREMLEAAGLEVIAFDTNDDAAAREMARGLSWDQGTNPMNVDEDLFALYTLAKKPVKPETTPETK